VLRIAVVTGALYMSTSAVAQYGLTLPGDSDPLFEKTQLARVARDLMYDDVAVEFGTYPNVLIALCEYRESEGIANEQRCARYWGQVLESSGEGVRGTLARVLGTTKAETVAARAIEIAYLREAERGRYQEPGARIPVASDGHFYARPIVNGVPIDMLVDTGASVVVLSERDARAVGINTEELAYDQPFATASGYANFARAKVEEIEFAGLRLGDIDVMVAPIGDGLSLLGMTVLRRFATVEVSSREMRIWP
jgi:clan AA aspartic protease (TIGR02281 family)